MLWLWHAACCRGMGEIRRVLCHSMLDGFASWGREVPAFTSLGCQREIVTGPS